MTGNRGPMPEKEMNGAGHGDGAAVEVTGIARRFGHRWALRGVSLRVEPGEVAALIGHNGSGKTTLLRVISTAIRPTRGTGRVFGFDLVRDAHRIRELLGVLGHSPGLYGDLTARENLDFALRMCGGVPPGGRDIEAALEAVGLGRETEELVRTFSAGMQRRLALARLTLRRPRLILLDEPYAAFDSNGIERVNALLARHKAEGGSAIVSTHNLARAESVVDRVWALARGALVDVAGQEPSPGGEGSTPEAIGEEREKAIR